MRQTNTQKMTKCPLEKELKFKMLYIFIWRKNACPCSRWLRRHGVSAVVDYTDTMSAWLRLRWHGVSVVVDDADSMPAWSTHYGHGHKHDSRTAWYLRWTWGKKNLNASLFAIRGSIPGGSFIYIFPCFFLYMFLCLCKAIYPPPSP